MSEQMKTPRKWTKVLLIVSLALNACFIGLIIGVKLTQDGMRPQRAPSAQGSLYLRALSHEDRAHWANPCAAITPRNAPNGPRGI